MRRRLPLAKALVLAMGLIALAAGASAARAAVLFVNHFDRSLDADHSLYGEPKATAAGFGLSEEGQGYPFEGAPGRRALDAGSSGKAKPDAGVFYSAVNLDSRRGTIELWVRPDWDADQPQTRKDDRFHHFLSVPLERKGSLSLYYACYRWNSFIPYIAFHINTGRQEGDQGPDYIVNFRVVPDEKGQGLVWKKGTWYYLVATWTPRELRLFANGKLLGERVFDRPMDIPLPAGPLVLGNNCANGWGPAHCPAEALIDEVRICDAPLYEGQKEIPVPTAPLAHEIKGQTLAAGGFAAFTRPDQRQYYCYQVTAPPQIDGRLDDPVWEKLPAWTGFLHYGKADEFIPQQTELRLCRDGRFIYVAALMYDDHPDQLKADARPGPDEDPRVFGDDCIEFYFGPKLHDVPDVQIGISSTGAHCDLLHQANKADFKWNGRARFATARTPQGWVVELAFPYQDVADGPPKIGDVWGFRAGRNHARAGLLSAVNYASIGFQNPPEFARLIMAGDLPALDVVSEACKLNAAYLADAKRRAAAFVDEARRQLGFAAEVPAEARDRYGLSALQREVQATADEAAALADGRDRVGMERWNRLSLALKTAGEKLDRFAYLVATAGSQQAPPPAGLEGIRQQDDCWYLAGPELAAAVDARRGRLVGLWDRTTGRRLLTGGYLIYEVQTKKSGATVDERSDAVTQAAVRDGRLVLQCTNAALPGLAIGKTYRLAEVEGQKRLLCRRLELKGPVPEMTLVQVTSRTLFDASFREPSWYNRIYVIGTQGDSRSRVAAKDITQPILQRAWFNATEGRSQFALVNPAAGMGLAEYLYLENDRWVFPQSLPMSYWTPFGWDLSAAATFVKPAPYSVELRYHLFRGDHTVFHREYLGLPEYQQVRREQVAAPAASRLAASMGLSGGQVVGDNPHTRDYIERTAGSMRKLLRPDELGLSAWMPHDTRWPDLPVGDDAEVVQMHNEKSGVVLGKWPAKGCREAVERIKQVNPNLLSNTYSFITDIWRGSRAFREHPEWIVLQRDGTMMPGYFGSEYVRANWCPAFVKHLTERLLALCDYMHLDLCYLDFGVGTVLADWGRGEVIGFPVYLDFIRHLQAQLHQRGKMLFLNSFVGQPYFDIGYFEGLGTAGHWGKSWRDYADVVMMTKFYAPPEATIIPLYWLAGDMFKERGDVNEVPYINMVVAAGLQPTGCYLDPYHIHFPLPKGGADWMSIYQYTAAVHHACYEIRHSRWVDVGVEPCWWRDLTTPLEVHTLQLQPPEEKTWLVNVISHDKAAADAALTVDLAKMGLEPAQRLFVWQFLLRDYAAYPKQAPPPANWRELFSSRTCRSLVPGQPRFRYSVPQLPPERVCVTALTPTPAAIAAAAGIPTQTLLPRVPGCRVTGSADETARTLALAVTADKDVELLAWWPAGWGKARITVGDRTVPGSPAAFGEESFIRFSLDKGQWQVQIRAE